MHEFYFRECPNCKTKFFKEEGCNKMSCPKCKTSICYLCKQVVKVRKGTVISYKSCLSRVLYLRIN